jgi:glyoxylase-like metal-dependent hydrolase (beta-lactamase superfamily II)
MSFAPCQISSGAPTAARFDTEEKMSRRILALSSAVLATAAFTAMSQAQTPAPPAPYAVTKVDGTDNVFIFRYGGHQAMFIVTKDGVIATDPISLRRPAAKAYVEEIEKITKAPIKYVIYSHHHFDHIAGGKPFKDKGAVFVAHQNAKKRILEVKDPDVVVPDQVVTGAKQDIKLGGTTLELHYVGKNHSDNTLVMRLPKEKIIFTVDWIPLQAVQFRGMPDSYLPDIMDGMGKVIAMDWERLIPGHPGPGGRQTGTKDDARNALTYLQDLQAAVKQAASEGKCIADAMKDIKLPKYEGWTNYGPFLPMNVERFCYFYNLGM